MLRTLFFVGVFGMSCAQNSGTSRQNTKANDAKVADAAPAAADVPGTSDTPAGKPDISPLPKDSSVAANDVANDAGAGDVPSTDNGNGRVPTDLGKAPEPDVLADTAPLDVPSEPDRGPQVVDAGELVLPDGLVGKPVEGKPDLPAFSKVKNTSNQLVDSQVLTGHWTVLWFYPMASTSGWTTEGCGFRDLYTEFQALGVEIVGCSFDQPAKNKLFKLNEKFQYELLSDLGKELALFYGAASSQFAFFANRVTVVLDPAGRWILSYPKVSPKGHPAQVLSDMKAILQ